MKSLAIVRATDILKLKSTLIEMHRAGLEFECQPKEINPASVEKILSKESRISDRKYEFCALVPVIQDNETSLGKIKGVPLYSDLLLMDASHELFESFVRLIKVLPDLDIPLVHKDAAKQIEKKAGTSVYLGVFVNRRVQVQSSSGTMYTGILRHADSIGVFFEPSDGSSPIFFTWHDIKKVIIPKEEKID
ncbi:MAG: DUF356 domain-containing protein [Candidatus Methanoperedens sp.]|nr:DUF356 domain-containing protein [Candidatus Methanoperedens sp.]MCZ7359370.1 DUF356 domain-containing protein [Candidatus Methanoperedens sp.]HLB70038.1 DUF356 domain-containing protein [Candidatus Methanoperedens sp.]